METEKYSPEEAFKEAEIIKSEADDLKMELGDDRTNTEHYRIAEKRVEGLCSRYLSISNVSEYLETLHAAEKIGVEDLLRSVLKQIVDFSHSNGLNIQNIDDAHFNSLNDQEVAESFASSSCSLLNSVAVEHGENISQEVQELFYSLMYHYALATTERDSLSQPEEGFEVHIGTELENMSWGEKGQLVFERLDNIKHDGKRIPAYSAYLKVKLSNRDEYKWIDLTNYFQNQGKKVLFTGLGATGNSVRFMGVAAERIDDQHIIGLNREELQKSFFDACFAIFHELGHVEAFGEDIENILRGIGETSNQYGDEETIAQEIQSAREKMQRELEQNLKRRESLNSIIGAASMFGEEYQTVTRNIFIIEQAIKVMEKNGRMTPEDVEKIQKYPELGKLLSIYHERRACKFALKRISEIDPDIFDYAARIETASKFYLNSRSNIDGDERFSRNFEGLNKVEEDK